MRILQGIGLCRGIAMAPVRILAPACGVSSSSTVSRSSDPEREARRFQAAVDTVERELARLRDRCGPDLADAAAIIDAHLLMLRDRMLHGRTLELIQEYQARAEWALGRAVAMVEEALARVDDRYLRERCMDVRHVARRIHGALTPPEQGLPGGEGEPVILAARGLDPGNLLSLPRRRIAGLAMEDGGVTSHTAIVARSLGIPTVAAVSGLLDGLADGGPMIVDGTNGRVFIDPDAETSERYQSFLEDEQGMDEETALHVHLAAETLDGLPVRVTANIETRAELPAVLRYGAEGIGLFRSEFDFFQQGRQPAEEELCAVYQEVLGLPAPMPVTIRILDMGGDKAVPRPLEPQKNPALGLRSIRYCLHEPDIFRLQLRALLRAASHGNLRILLPMISSVEEMDLAREHIAAVTGELRREGHGVPAHVPVGVLIEVPAAVPIAGALARRADFFSIGTNDLIQYSLAVDRDNHYVAPLYDPLHPAVLRMIHQVAEAAHQADIEVGVCGEMAGDQAHVPLLLALGVDELSMRPPAVPRAKALVRASTFQGLEEIAAQVLDCSSSAEVSARLDALLPALYPREFGGSG